MPAWESLAVFRPARRPGGRCRRRGLKVLPFATALERPTYALRRGLGTGAPQERDRPGATGQVTVFHLRAVLERAVRTARRMLESKPRAPAHTWCRRVSGGQAPHDLRMVPRGDRADFDRFDRFDRDLAGLLSGHQAALDDYAAAAHSAEVETWRYRPEPSLLPPGGNQSPWPGTARRGRPRRRPAQRPAAERSAQPMTPSCLPIRVNAPIAWSRCSRVCAALICVRMRAWPCGTTG